MNTAQNPLLIAGISGTLVGLMTFATRWLLSGAKAGLSPEVPEHQTALAVYTVAIEGVVLFGLIGAILVTLATWVALAMSERAPSAQPAEQAAEAPPAPAPEEPV